jgi:hypothetical protein
MLQEFIDMNNRVIDRFSPEERKNIGIHTCPGGDMDSVHSKEVPYGKLLSKMFQLDEKPKHGSPDFARDIAMQEVSDRVKGAAMASEELGI